VFRTPVERLPFVVRRVANMSNDCDLCVPYLGQRKQRSSLHFDSQHTFFTVLIELLSSLVVRCIGSPHRSSINRKPQPFQFTR